MAEVADLRITNGTVVTMDPPGTATRSDVVVCDGRIVAIGDARDVPVRTTLDATGAVVLPGLVQAHVHVVQSLLRHQADGLELLDWLRLRTWPYEASLDGDAVEAAAELGIAELLCGGTTTALDFGTVRHHERVLGAAERLGIRLVSGKTHMDAGEGVPAALLEDRDRSLADAEALGRRWHGAGDGRVRYAVAPRFALSCTSELLGGCAELARREGWLLQTHAAENRDETRTVREATGLGTIRFLERVGMLGPDVVLAHCVWLDDDEVDLLAATGTSVCHCPGANLKLASGVADVPRLRAAGIRVALGADGPPCNNRLSAFAEMSLAATLHGLRHGPRAVGAWDALAMATTTGADALGLGGRIGVLRPGAAADLVVVDVDGWSCLPAGDPASRLVHGAGAGDVRHTVVAGRVVVRDGVLTSADPDGIRERAREAWRATSARMEEAA